MAVLNFPWTASKSGTLLCKEKGVYGLQVLGDELPDSEHSSSDSSWMCLMATTFLSQESGS